MYKLFVLIKIREAITLEKKSKVAAGLLALFLGGIGVHKFYLGQTLAGILYLLFCWTGIPHIIAFVEAIIILTMADADFDAKYNADCAQPARPQQPAPTCAPQINTAYHPVQAQSVPVSQAVKPAPQKDTENTGELLMSYKKLLDEGVITQDEFAAVKNKLLK